MADQHYWFARRYPVGRMSNSMAPVSAEGFRVVWTFVAIMGGGAIVAAILGIAAIWAWWLPILGMIIFIAAAIYGGWYFISTARKHCDRQHTVAEYKAGQVPGQKPYGK